MNHLCIPSVVYEGRQTIWRPPESGLGSPGKKLRWH